MACNNIIQCVSISSNLSRPPKRGETHCITLLHASSESNSNPFQQTSPVRPITYVELYQSSVNWTGFVEMDSNWIPIYCVFASYSEYIHTLPTLCLPPRSTHAGTDWIVGQTNSILFIRFVCSSLLMVSSVCPPPSFDTDERRPDELNTYS